MIVQGDYIFQSSEEMNISAQFNDIGAKIQLELPKNTQISLKTRQPTILLVNNEEHLVNYQIDQEMLELYLEQGLYEIELFI